MTTDDTTRRDASDRQDPSDPAREKNKGSAPDVPDEPRHRITPLSGVTTDGLDDETEEHLESDSAPSLPGAARPYVRIIPAREAVVPEQVVTGLYGLYRTGFGRQLPFGLDRRLSILDTHRRFEFLIHKPADTQRFEFYAGVHPYEVAAVEALVSATRTMFPDTFDIKIVPFAPRDVFAPATSGSDFDLSQYEGIESLVDEASVSPDPSSRSSSSKYTSTQGGESVDDDLHAPPAIVRWGGVETQPRDWMTLLSRSTEVATDSDDQYRASLSVLLDRFAETDRPTLFQAVMSPRADWTTDAERQKRNLKQGINGVLSAFKQEAASTILGSSEEERKQRHRPDNPEQIGGSLPGSDRSTHHDRMAQIDLKQPSLTFDLSLRVAGSPSVIDSVLGCFSSLSGPYYGVEGQRVAVGREVDDLLHARLGRSNIRDRLGRINPVLVVSPDELAHFVTVPHTEALPASTRGASGGRPDARSPLKITDEETLRAYNQGVCIGSVKTVSGDQPDIPIRLQAEQLCHHVLRASTTGSGKSTAMINDALEAFDHLDGPVFVFDKKGGSMSSEYKRAHFRRFGRLDGVSHFSIPGPNGELPAFPFFDIRPELAAGVPRETAVQERIDRYSELVSFVIGQEAHDQAFVAREILGLLIAALFDPQHGQDAWGISDLFRVATRMQTERSVPNVSDPELELALTRHFSSDERRFETSIDAVLNRITKLREREFLWRLLDFVPKWDDDAQRYADDQRLLDPEALLAGRRVFLIDLGQLRPESSNIFTVLFLDYLWSWIRLRHRHSSRLPTPADDYCVNLIIDEAAPILQSQTVRDEMIPDAREFGLGFELIIHFPEQVKSDSLDSRGYKEILRNVNTKLIGKLGADDELAATMFHEGVDADELMERAASLPRGEFIAQLPDQGFGTAVPEMVSLVPLPVPPGHSDGADAVEAETVHPDTKEQFADADRMQWIRTRDRFCLVPGLNTSPSAAQRAARHEPGRRGTSSTRNLSDSTPDSSNKGETDARPTDGAEFDQTPMSNDLGTSLGVGGPPVSPTSSDPPDDRPGTDTGLTSSEREFLRAVVAALNQDLDGYDTTQSMLSIRDRIDGDIDEDSLADRGLLKIETVAGRKYYYVTPAGQEAVDRSVVAGRGLGDPNEQVVHKVLVDYYRRFLELDGLHVETYYEVPDGSAVFDVAGFNVGEDGEWALSKVGEVVATSTRRVVKHYDDITAHPVTAAFVVPNIETAHEIARSLHRAGRIEDPPAKDVHQYSDLSIKTFGDTGHGFVGAQNLVEFVDEREVR